MAKRHLTVLEILEGARYLLSLGWHQFSQYGDSSGQDCNIDHAVSFCMIGAINAHHDWYKAHHQESPVKVDLETTIAARQALRKVLPEPAISSVNDRASTTHAKVMRWMDLAIKHEKETG